MTGRTSVFIVDDHAVVRDGLRSVLALEPDIDVTGEAADVGSALAGIERGAAAGALPHVVVLDLRLGAGNGLSLCRELGQRHPTVRVLVFTTYLEERLVVEAVRAGAAGYVVKDIEISGLVRAVRRVAAGRTAFDERTTAILARAVGRQAHEDQVTLSTRELEVLQLVARGLPNRAIAERLLIAEMTAKFHVANILRKLGVSRRAEVHWRATQLGLLGSVTPRAGRNRHANP